MAGKLTLQKICESFGIFFLIWTIRVLCLSGFPPAGQSLWIQQLLAELLKGILWIGFAFYMIQRYHTRLWLKPQKMLLHPIATRSLVLPAALFVLQQVVLGLWPVAVFCICLMRKEFRAAVPLQSQPLTSSAVTVIKPAAALSTRMT